MFLVHYDCINTNDSVTTFYEFHFLVLQISKATLPLIYSTYLTRIKNFPITF